MFTKLVLETLRHQRSAIFKLKRNFEKVFMVQLGKQSKDARVYGISGEVAHTPGFD